MGTRWNEKDDSAHMGGAGSLAGCGITPDNPTGVVLSGNYLLCILYSSQPSCQYMVSVWQT